MFRTVYAKLQGEVVLGHFVRHESHKRGVVTTLMGLVGPRDPQHKGPWLAGLRRMYVGQRAPALAAKRNGLGAIAMVWGT